MRLQSLNRGKLACAHCFPAFRGQLQHDGQIPAWSNHCYGVLQATGDASVLENQSRVNKLNRVQCDVLFREVHAVELKTTQMRVALPDGLEVKRVYVQPYDAYSRAAINAVESVSTGDSQDRD